MPKLPHSSEPSQLIDLIAFFGILTLGGVLMAFGHATAGSLATACAALAALFTAWKRLRSRSDSSNTEDADRESNERTHDNESGGWDGSHDEI
jgi:hypothetical protein